MFNFTLIEKYNNIWQTDKPRVNSFTGYHSWNIKTWLFTSYAKLRERDTQISSHLSSSAYVVMYTEYIHYPHRFYTNQIKIKISQLTDFLCWFYFFKYCISSLIRYVLPLHLLFTCIYEWGGMGQTVLAVQAYWKRNAKPTSNFYWFSRKNETSPFCRFFQTWWKSLFAKNI